MYTKRRVESYCTEELHLKSSGSRGDFFGDRDVNCGFGSVVTEVLVEELSNLVW